MTKLDTGTHLTVFAKLDGGWKLAHGNVRDLAHAREIAAKLISTGAEVRIRETTTREVV